MSSKMFLKNSDYSWEHNMNTFCSWVIIWNHGMVFVWAAEWDGNGKIRRRRCYSAGRKMNLAEKPLRVGELNISKCFLETIRAERCHSNHTFPQSCLRKMLHNHGTQRKQLLQNYDYSYFKYDSKVIKHNTNLWCINSR